MRLHALAEALEKAGLEVDRRLPLGAQDRRPGRAVTCGQPRSRRDGCAAATQAEVNAVVTDSRRAAPGAVFCALRGGRRDGAEFIADAARRGAAAAITEKARAGAPPLPQLVVPDARAAMRVAAWAVWGPEARAVRLAAVTGTNGKTTTAALLREMLSVGGLPAGLVGTLGCDTGDGLRPTGFTTPETAELLEALAAMARRGMTNAVIEASSHALALGRLDGLEPDVAVFTNLTRDHLDFHGTMESYLEAKAILFEKLAPDATAVLNHEDPSSGKLARGTRARILWTGLGEGCDVRVAELERDGRAKLVRTSFGGSAVELGWLLPGRHNLENLASAAGAAFAAGVRPDAIARAASRFRGVPGRLERVDEGQGFGVYVDYAHTPDALERVLGSLRPETEGRLVVLFGCGGDRDRTKRPKMGELAERAADEAIVTSDNPRGEEPMLIIDEILAGARDRSRLRVVPDREEAIGLAVSIARAGDTVLLAGKGHETEQIIGEERRPFDDRLVAARLLRERLARAA